MFHIDLNNFEKEEFQNSEYVLTSPLSLQACQNLNLKPFDLLPDLSTDAQHNVEKERFEKQRKLNVLKAKVERQRLINEIRACKQNIFVQGKKYSRGKNGPECSYDDNCCHQRVLTNVEGGYNSTKRVPPLSASRTDGSLSLMDEPKNVNSLIRELQFHQKRKVLEQMAKEEKNERIKIFETKLSRAAKNKDEIQKKKKLEMETKRKAFHNKLINVSHRRSLLEEEILNYHCELEKFREITLKSAEQKMFDRLQKDQLKIQYEREYKELVNRHNREIIQEEEAIKNNEMMMKIMEKDRQNDLFLQEKLNRLMQSRCLANEAQKVREEIKKIYNTDSFDKKATYVELVNHVIK